MKVLQLAASVLLLIILSMLISGCLPRNSPDVGTSWTLDTLTVDGASIDILTSHPITLEIRENNGVGGSAGCNSYGGEVLFRAGGNLETRNLFQTEMWCEVGMDVEAAFLSALNSVTHYEWDENTLTLSNSDLQTLLIFQVSE